MLKTVVVLLFVITGALFIIYTFFNNNGAGGAPPFGDSETEASKIDFTEAIEWKRPDGPAKVGIQIGHYKNDEVPEELEKLKNNTGASGGGKREWEVNFEIAHLVANNLETHGVVVEILPTTVPPSYWADVFIAIHADGSTDKSKSGYKFAGPWRDYSKKADKLINMLEKQYGPSTGLEKDQNITRNMRGYYAFSWWRYKHSVHPMTTAVIAETGFLTNQKDQRLLINTPQIPAEAISSAIIDFLKSEGLL